VGREHCARPNRQLMDEDGEEAQGAARIYRVEGALDEVEALRVVGIAAPLLRLGEVEALQWVHLNDAGFTAVLKTLFSSRRSAFASQDLQLLAGRRRRPQCFGKTIPGLSPDFSKT
jgi:voltage-gated potassium channel Kch